MGKQDIFAQNLFECENRLRNRKNSISNRLTCNDYKFPLKYVRKLNRKGIDMIETVSNGGSGTVYRADVRCYPIRIQKSASDSYNCYTNKKRILSITGNRRQIAVKYVDLVDKCTKINCDEADIMLKLNHPNIVHVYEAIVYDSKHLFILMEYCSDGTLETFLRRCSPDIKGEILTEAMANSFIQQLSDALLYIHGRKLTHGDFHEANVLVFKEYEPKRYAITLKICDFGFAEISSLENINEDMYQLEKLNQMIRDKTNA